MKSLQSQKTNPKSDPESHLDSHTLVGGQLAMQPAAAGDLDQPKPQATEDSEDVLQPGQTTLQDLYPNALFPRYWARRGAAQGMRFLMRWNTQADLPPFGCPCCSPVPAKMLQVTPGMRYSATGRKSVQARVNGMEAAAVANGWLLLRIEERVKQELGIKPLMEWPDVFQKGERKQEHLPPNRILNYFKGFEDNPVSQEMRRQAGADWYFEELTAIKEALFLVKLNQKTASNYVNQGLVKTVRQWKAEKAADEPEMSWLPEQRDPGDWYCRGETLKRGLDWLRHWILLGGIPPELDAACLAATWLFPDGLHGCNSGPTIVRMIAQDVYRPCEKHKEDFAVVFGQAEERNTRKRKRHKLLKSKERFGATHGGRKRPEFQNVADPASQDFIEEVDNRDEETTA